MWAVVYNLLVCKSIADLIAVDWKTIKNRDVSRLLNSILPETNKKI